MSRGSRRWTAPSRPDASPSRRPIRCTSFTRRVRRACRRASSATRAATPSRCSGRWGRSTAPSRATSTGRPQTSAGWSATPTSSTGRFCRAARPFSTRASRSAHPMPARSGACARTTGWMCCSPPRRRSGRSSGMTRAATHMGGHDLSRLRTLFLAGERCDPDTLAWAERSLGRPVIDHWWQTETGWPIAANCIGVERLPVRARLLREARSRATTCACSTSRATQVPAGEIGATLRQAAAASRLQPHAVGRRPALGRAPTCRTTTATT